jgi:hypothetical protein
MLEIGSKGGNQYVYPIHPCSWIQYESLVDYGCPGLRVSVFLHVSKYTLGVYWRSCRIYALGLATEMTSMVYILIHGPQSIIRVYWPVYKIVNSWPCCRDPALWVPSCFMVPVYRVALGLAIEISCMVYILLHGPQSIIRYNWPVYKVVNSWPCCRDPALWASSCFMAPVYRVYVRRWYRDPALSMGYNAVL